MRAEFSNFLRFASYYARRLKSPCSKMKKMLNNCEDEIKRPKNKGLKGKNLTS